MTDAEFERRTLEAVTPVLRALVAAISGCNPALAPDRAALLRLIAARRVGLTDAQAALVDDLARGMAACAAHGERACQTAD